MNVELIASGVLGGLILNVMPCVLPVLFFKASSWIDHADASPKDRRRDAIGYLLGTWVTFGAFAGLVEAARASGRALGWGMHMQSSPFVAALITLVFVFGLNALGVFSINISFGGGRSTEGWISSIMDGALITLIATPCSAPFLGGAATAALASDTLWYETLAMFWSIGFGLSVPVLLLGFVPAFNRLLPRPGAWMNTMKHLVGYTMFGAAVWLFETFQVQVSPSAANGLLWFLLALSFGLWAWEKHGQRDGSVPMRWIFSLVMLGGVSLVGWQLVSFEPMPKMQSVAIGDRPSSVIDGKIVWTAYDPVLRAQAAKQGRPVFVDFTADWCASCKTFEKTHLSTASMAEAFDDSGVLAMKADLTASGDALWKLLAGLNRSGIPAYVIYLPDGTFDLLPEGPPLTLKARLRKAAERWPPAKFASRATPASEG